MELKKLIIGIITAYLLFFPDLSCYIPFLSPSKTLIIITAILLFMDILVGNRIGKYTLDIKLAKPVLIIIMISLYTVLLTFINKYSLEYNYAGLLVPIKLMDFYLVNNILTKFNYTYKAKIDFFLTICTIQAVICVMMLFVPSLKEIANTIYISGIENYHTSGLAGITRFRIYGLFGDYTCAGQILMGMASGVALSCYLSKKRRLYIFETVIILLASIMNGRTGVIAFLVSVLGILIFGTRDKTKLNIKLIGNITFLSGFFLVLLIVYISTSDSIAKFEDAIKIIEEILSEDSDSEYTKMIVFPKGLSFVFGEGHRIFGLYGMDSVGFSSDFGYVNDMFRGGLVYCIIYYLANFRIANEYSKYIEDNLVRLLEIVMIVFFILGNYKGEIASGSSVMCGIWFVSFAIRTEGKGKINEKGNACLRYKTRSN